MYQRVARVRRSPTGSTERKLGAAMEIEVDKRGGPVGSKYYEDADGYAMPPAPGSGPHGLIVRHYRRKMQVRDMHNRNLIHEELSPNAIF